MNPLDYRRGAVRLRVLVAFGLACMVAAAQAVRLPASAPAGIYERECGACHLAYPPELLPAASWRRLVDSLDRHFGTDASLDEPSRAAISAWLQKHASSDAKAAKPPERITLAGWFMREHAQVVLPASPAGGRGSMSDCAACHPAAAQGRFEDADGEPSR